MIALAILLAAGEIVWPPHSPRLSILGPGPVFNIFQGVDAANSNASAHLAWGILVPVIGERIGGRKGLWYATAGNVALTLIHESMFHNAEGPEVRTDLASRALSSIATAGVYELLHAVGWLDWH